MSAELKVARNKMKLLDLAEYLKNVSEACRVSGVSRQHFYDIKQAFAEGGIDALRDQSRRKPILKNRVSPEVEEAVVRMADDFPAYGQLRVANELKKHGVVVSSGGVRSIWLRHNLETFDKRLKRLEEKSAQAGIVFTEAQLIALENAKREKESDPDSIETHHPGFLISQDTMYVGCLKGVGRIYQQTVVDTYSAVAFAKIYETKVPVTSADLLNDRVLPFFEEHGVIVQRVLTDRGTEYCGKEETHAYELFLGLNEIEHTCTKTKHPQTNGICERFHQTCLNEFYKVTFRKKMYRTMQELQDDLDLFIKDYNETRTHQGVRCKGSTPMQTFLTGVGLALAKQISPPASAAENGPLNGSSEAANRAASALG